LFATGVNDTGGKFAVGVVDTGSILPPASLIPVANCPPLSLTPVANLPPVTTKQKKLVAKFAGGVVDTDGKFATVSLIPEAILPPMSLTPVANLQPVSLISVVHLELWISPWIFEKICYGPNGILGAGGKLIHEKTQKQQISWHYPFNIDENKSAQPKSIFLPEFSKAKDCQGQGNKSRFGP
jgi:hypothetical protein